MANWARPVLQQLLQVLDVAGHAAHDHAGLLLGEEVERESLQVGEDLDPEVVHDPRRQAAGDPGLAPLGATRHHDGHEVERGADDHDGEVVVGGRQAVVDGVRDETRSQLREQRDDADQEGGQRQHAGVLHEQRGQGEALLLVLRRQLGEDDVGLAPLRLLLQQQVDALLEFVRDAAEGKAGLRRAGRAAAADGWAAASEHQIAPFSGSSTSSSVWRSPSSGWRSTPSGSRAMSSKPRPSTTPAAVSSAACSSLAAWASTSE